MRITMRKYETGAITEFLIPKQNAEPHGLAICSKGNIWFAEQCDQIGRLVIN
ncbi:hypothetical protein IFO66_14935 [Paenibacillus sp. CAU 1523]|uniref:Uncharacterized protein n=1 Tax=Paenibacillus arenosi TaxID=2774142 RepID=A0ABR9AZU2_9BACL|nr:hypothetical protein [Paenibacillus arenosi]